MKKYFLLFATYIFLILNSFAQIEDHFDISQSDLEFETMGNYTIVSFPNCSFLSDTGKPQLPYIELRYLIPYNSKAASISIMDSSFQIISGNYLLYPAQPDYPINEEVTTFVEPDSEIYNMNTPYPDNLIKIADQEYNKGYHIVTLHIYPLSYRPIQRKLVLYSSIIFRINFSDQENPPLHPQNQSEQMYGIVKSNILSQIKNKSDIEILDGGTVNIISTKSGENNNDNINSSFFYNDIIPDYIIITSNTDIDGNLIPLYNNKSMIQIFQELADWKTKKGIPTKVITLDEISSNYQGCDLQEKIHNYLKYIYENWGTKFVLFGGDVNIFPARLLKFGNGYYPSDLYYTGFSTNGSVLRTLKICC